MSSSFNQRATMRGSFLIAMGVLALGTGPAQISRAAERVTLSNGFVELCDHHAQVEGRVRLYLTAAEDSYIEFTPSDIASVEKVPDPPPAAVPSPASASKAQAKLTSADLGEMLGRAGEAHNLDVDLLASVVKAESDGNPQAVSRAGAQGLMQLMPGTAAGLGVHDSFQPEQNVRGGSTYLDSLLTRYHDNLALALAATMPAPKRSTNITASRPTAKRILRRPRDSRIQSPRARPRRSSQPRRSNGKRAGRSSPISSFAKRCGAFPANSSSPKPLTCDGRMQNWHPSFLHVCVRT